MSGRPSWLVIVFAVLSVLSFAAIPFIPEPHYAMSQEALTAEWAGRVLMTLGVGFAAAAWLKHKKDGGDL